MTTLVEYYGAPAIRWALIPWADGSHVVRWVDSERDGVARLRRGPYDGAEPWPFLSRLIISRHTHREPALARVAVLDGTGVEGLRQLLDEPVPADPRRYFWLELAREAARGGRAPRCKRGHLRTGPNAQGIACRACNVAIGRRTYAALRAPRWSEDELQRVSDEIYEKYMRDAGLDPWLTSD
ncbi:hypothetical protein [Pseudonocardia alni]|uniref:hypothetical protein n=1 Tax=Pseudonocardia alni TaxID=33907 RepID=UPI00332E8974